jgi:hypothetical protein
MKLSDWASVAEIASAVAVVASLVYVGVEIRQNTAATQASTAQALLDYGRAHSDAFINNPDTAKLIDTGEVDPSSLTPLERRRFYEFTTWRFSVWELTFLNHAAGLVDDDLWSGWDAYFRRIISGKRGYSLFWSDTREQWDAGFMKYIDSEGLSTHRAFE